MILEKNQPLSADNLQPLMLLEAAITSAAFCHGICEKGAKVRPQVDIPTKLLTWIFTYAYSQERRGNGGERGKTTTVSCFHSCNFPLGKGSSLGPQGTAEKHALEPHHAGEEAADFIACVIRRSYYCRLSPTSTQTHRGQVFFSPPCPQPNSLTESFVG